MLNMLASARTSQRNLMPLSMKQLQKLWSNRDAGPRLATERYESYYKKAIDSVCMEADMCESVDDYVVSLCNGMQQLIDQGIPKSSIINHPIALNKILRLGEDIMEVSHQKSDIFYIGIFIDLRIAMNWFQKKFYQLVKLLIDQITRNAKGIPTKLKQKLIMLMQKENFTLYAQYFLDPAPHLKKVA